MTPHSSVARILLQHGEQAKQRRAILRWSALETNEQGPRRFHFSLWADEIGHRNDAVDRSAADDGGFAIARRCSEAQSRAGHP